FSGPSGSKGCLPQPSFVWGRRVRLQQILQGRGVSGDVLHSVTLRHGVALVAAAIRVIQVGQIPDVGIHARRESRSYNAIWPRRSVCLIRDYFGLITLHPWLFDVWRHNPRTLFVWHTGHLAKSVTSTQRAITLARAGSL